MYRSIKLSVNIPVTKQIQNNNNTDDDSQHLDTTIYFAQLLLLESELHFVLSCRIYEGVTLSVCHSNFQTLDLEI